MPAAFLAASLFDIFTFEETQLDCLRGIFLPACPHRGLLRVPPPHITEALSDDAAVMSKAIILREFWNFLRVRKKFWLAPIVVVLVLLSLLIVLTQGSALAPFVYALF